jgi:periplasmic divalent cation tolerance protein
MSAIIIFSSTSSRDEARQIAQSLVGSRLAACVNILPKMESVYRWQDNVEHAEEYLLVIKSDSTKFDEIAEAVKTMHSYELPECVAIDVSEGSSEYLAWIRETTGS